MCVSWDEAQAYVQWLNTQTLGGYRLLSEAEWEYAARAGSTTAYPWGDAASHEYANYGADPCCRGWASGRDQWVNTSPVGEFPAGAFGLNDMIGNVWEWTDDCYAWTLDGVPSDGSAFAGDACTHRAVRGGAWNDGAEDLRSSARYRDASEERYDSVGFRVARTPG